MKLTAEQRNLAKPLLPATPKDPRGQGMAPPRLARDILNGILWKLITGSPWERLPGESPPSSTCHRWLRYWRETGTFEGILAGLAEIAERRKLDLNEAYIDATFASAKKGACAGKTKKGQDAKIMAIAKGCALPIASLVECASPGEAALAEKTIEARFVEKRPTQLPGDKAYDSDKLDERLDEKYGMKPIAPNRKNRRKTQDGSRCAGAACAGRLRYALLGYITVGYDVYSVMDSCRSALLDNGVLLTQYPVPVEGENRGLVTKLVHAETGQYQASLAVIPLAKPDPQAMGIAFTYGRRYALSAMLGIVTEEDDDGNAASSPKGYQAAKPKAVGNSPSTAKKGIRIPLSSLLAELGLEDLTSCYRQYLQSEYGILLTK